MALAALATLVLNDHVAKARWHDAVTGKASDVAGLILVPLLLGTALELALGRVCRPRGDDPRVLAPPAMAALVTTTGLAFAATKVWGPAGQAYRVVMGVAQWVPTAAWAVVAGRPLPTGTRCRWWPTGPTCSPCWRWSCPSP